MKDLDCFLFQYFRRRREAKSKLSKVQSELDIVVSGITNNNEHNLYLCEVEVVLYFAVVRDSV